MILKLTNEQLAYIAGFIDADGSLECQRQVQKKGKTPRYVLRLSFTLATREPLDTFVSWIDNLTIKEYPPTDPTRSKRVRLHIPKSIAVNLLEMCLPYLILKRRQAELMLEIESIRAEYTPSRKHYGLKHMQPMPSIAIEKMEVLYWELRSLKSNKRPGHCREKRAQNK